MDKTANGTTVVHATFGDDIYVYDSNQKRVHATEEYLGDDQVVVHLPRTGTWFVLTRGLGSLTITHVDAAAGVERRLVHLGLDTLRAQPLSLLGDLAERFRDGGDLVRDVNGILFPQKDPDGLDGFVPVLPEDGEVWANPAILSVWLGYKAIEA